jgi:hypothetical protein
VDVEPADCIDDMGTPALGGVVPESNVGLLDVVADAPGADVLPSPGTPSDAGEPGIAFGGIDVDPVAGAPKAPLLVGTP